MHVCEQNDALVYVSLNADSLGFLAERNANLISGVHITPRVADDCATICLSIDLGIKLYLQRDAIGAIGERILEPARVA